jgi:two-component system cell cycle response regulator
MMVDSSRGAKGILLTQIKQDFVTPANAIFDYLDIVEKAVSKLDLQSEDELNQIKSSCNKLINQYEEAFNLYTGSGSQGKKTPEEYSELRHNLRTPLNAIIGYGEILIEDFEEDIPESRTRRIIINDLKHIIELARETEKAIEVFVDFIRGDDNASEEGDTSQVETAEALFKSLGDIEHSITLSDELKASDILIVDDNKTNCEVLERRLSMSGLKCRTAYDGESALDEVKKKTPDLILLDVILPDINGLELLKRFRSKHSVESLPVIMVSAFDDVDSIAKCIQLGAQDYLPKPINGTVLLAKVVSSLERKLLREREKELVNELHIQATTDQLTGIANRRVIFDTLENAVSREKRKDYKPFAIIVFDIDFFKNVNDTYGHAGGDEVLKAFAKLLDSEITQPNQVGRIGGEEFLAIIYMENESLKIFANDLIEKIQKNVVKFEDTEISITASGGVAFSEESKSSSDLVNKADKRLYKAKKSGRNRFVLIDSEIVGE